MLKSIHIHVKSDFTIPDVYTGGLVEEIEEALWIGANIQRSVKTRRSNDEIRKITELHDSEIHRIQTSYNEKLTKLLSDIQKITLEKERLSSEYSDGLNEARVKEKDAVTREFNEKTRLLKMDHDLIVSRCESLESRRRILEESREKDIQDAVKRTEELMEKLVLSKEEQLAKMETAYARLSESISKQSDEISKMSSNLIRRSANVKTKGSDYEAEFGEKLKRVYGLCRGFVLKNTSSLGHEMDFSMEIEGHAVMWELKNYTSIVPKAEVEKFLRDLKENSSKIGVMISRSTDIYGKNLNGNILTEFDNDKMMVYINKFEEFCDDENRVFQMLTCLFRVWWEYHREENAFERVEIIRELEKIVDDISKRRTEWRRHKLHLDELNRWAIDLLDESENRLDKILKKVRAESIVTVPDIFRESGEKSGEKEMAWIQSIMKVCVIGGEIEVRELVELLGAHHKLSKDGIRTNVMSVIKDYAIIKKGVIKYISGISKR